MTDTEVHARSELQAVATQMPGMDEGKLTERGGEGRGELHHIRHTHTRLNHTSDLWLVCCCKRFAYSCPESVYQH